MSPLEQSFEARVRAAVQECHRIGYHPSDFEAMLANASAARVAERLVTSGDLQTGLRRLAKMGRLELSVESIMLEPEFQDLFKSADIRAAAQWRLDQVRGAVKSEKAGHGKRT